MKKENNIRFRVGLFVVGGLVIFIIGIYLLGKQKNLFGTNFHVNAIFRDVGGLQVGNNVRFSGINVGTVESILFIRDTSVLVTMVVDGNVQKYLRKDSRAIIGAEGLMGDKLINILPGTEKAGQIVDNQTIRSAQSVSVDEILQRLKETTENTSLITGDLADIIDNIHQGKGTIGALVMDNSFAKEFKQTVENVKKGTGGFSENMEAAKHSFLLKGFFKKKQKQKEEQQKAEQKKLENEKQEKEKK